MVLYSGVNMECCINNKIQVYLEELITKFGTKGVVGNDNKDKLYDWYKDIRVEVKSKGWLYCKERRNSKNKKVGEKFIANPKTIASGLFYLYCVYNGQVVTQKQICETMGTSVGTLTNSCRAIQNLINTRFNPLMNR